MRVHIFVFISVSPIVWPNTVNLSSRNPHFPVLPLMPLAISSQFCFIGFSTSPSLLSVLGAQESVWHYLTSLLVMPTDCNTICIYILSPDLSYVTDFSLRENIPFLFPCYSGIQNIFLQRTLVLRKASFINIRTRFQKYLGRKLNDLYKHIMDSCHGDIRVKQENIF